VTVFRGIVAVIAAAVTLFVSAAGSHPAVTRSQGWIAYSAEGMVWVANADGSRPRALARGESPSWSPDGSEIAFQSARVPGNPSTSI
jgi:Tol biopolymer transport system component